LYLFRLRVFDSDISSILTRIHANRTILARQLSTMPFM